MTKLFSAAMILASFAMFAAPASAMTEKMLSLKVHGHMMKIHAMTMDDGTTMVGLSPAQFERLTNQRYPQLMNR